MYPGFTLMDKTENIHERFIITITSNNIQKTKHIHTEQLFIFFKLMVLDF